MSKKKVVIEPMYLVKLTVTLALTSAIVAGLLGAVNGATAGPIAQINKEKTEAAMALVVADAAVSTFGEAMSVSEEMIAAAATYGGKIAEVYPVQVDGVDAGYAVKIIAGGSQGDIELMVGTDMDAAVTGVSIVKHKETSGIGTKVTGNVNGVLSQFTGMSHSVDGDFVVGSNLDAITGATVTTKGVTKGVNAAVAAVAAMS